MNCKHCGAGDVLRNRRECRPCHQRVHRAAKTRSAAVGRIRLKQETMDQYGGRCACCGVSDLVFLTIDHVDGGGAEHRRQIGSRSAREFYYWLKRNQYPDGFQVLCFNCNWAKSHGGCPHKLSVP